MAKKVKTRKDYSAPAPGEGGALDPLRDFEGGPLEKALFRFGYFIRDRMKETIMIIVGLVLVIGGIIGYSVWSDYREQKALRAFEDLLDEPALNASMGSSEKALEKLDAYTSRFSSQSALNRARLERLKIYDRELMHEPAAETSATIAKSVGDNYLKAYFYLQTASYYEMAGNHNECLHYYDQAGKRVQASNLLKALVLYGRGRCLVKQGSRSEGEKSIREMMGMKDVQGVQEFRISATAFLLSN